MDLVTVKLYKLVLDKLTNILKLINKKFEVVYSFMTCKQRKIRKIWIYIQ